MINLERRRLVTRTTSHPKQMNLPWLISQQGFFDACTRCGKCSQVCDTGIIQAGDGGYPSINFHIDECSFCYQCAEICPEPLFRAEAESPWQPQISLNQSCLAMQNIDCRSCAEACEPAAIQFRPALGRVAQPLLQHDTCTGCGACISHCPVNAINLALQEA